ncbi:MAG: response regulator [Candidatus Paceibacterota bacterium]|jgi:DNA-binding response OmpR family regulator
MDTSKKILVVEDDNFLGELLIEYLDKGGNKAILSRDAETALKMIRQDPPLLVLLDLLLPGMSGLELLETLKTENIVPGLPVIILSNLAQKEKIKKAIELGARDFLVKANFDLKEIANKVRTTLEIDMESNEETPRENTSVSPQNSSS